MRRISRWLFLGFGWMTLVGTAWAQHARPDRPPLPLVALGAEQAGGAAINALGDKLPGVASHHGLTAERLTKLLHEDRDLRVDHSGRLFFAESHLPDPEQAPETADA